MIRFETYQALSFTIAGSLFVFMTLAFITWFIRELFRNNRRKRWRKAL